MPSKLTVSVSLGGGLFLGSTGKTGPFSPSKGIIVPGQMAEAAPTPCACGA